MYDVFIDDIGLNATYGLILTSKDISAPEPQTNYITVPGRNGSIDLSEVLSGSPKFNDRTIDMKFYAPHKVDDWASIISVLQNRFTGKKLRIIFEDDLSYYWLGRIVSVKPEISGNILNISLSAIVHPFKYSITSSAWQWLWDELDFDQDAINEFTNIEVNGTKEISIAGLNRTIYPVVTIDAKGMFFVNRTMYHSGKHILYDIVLTPQNNKLTFQGTGTVTVEYVGGRL